MKSRNNDYDLFIERLINASYLMDVTYIALLIRQPCEVG